MDPKAQVASVVVLISHTRKTRPVTLAMIPLLDISVAAPHTTSARRRRAAHIIAVEKIPKTCARARRGKRSRETMGIGKKKI